MRPGQRSPKKASSPMTEKNPLFICGSGISGLAPASMPMVPSIMRVARTRLLPDETRQERWLSELVTNDIQPEVLFEQAVSIVGQECLQIWDILKRPPDGKWKPNLYHCALVWIASRRTSPIVTFNMDTLFEDAANTLGIEFTRTLYVAGCRATEGALDVPRTTSSVAIWKIHGCVATRGDQGASTLYNTMSQIARPNHHVIKNLVKAVGNCILCVVGYSGRDVDFFPHLCGEIRETTSVAPVWIDPKFAGGVPPIDPMARPTLQGRSELLRSKPTDVDLFDWLRQRYPQELEELAQKLGPAIYERLAERWKARNTQAARDEWRDSEQELVAGHESRFSFRGFTMNHRRALLVSALLYSGHTGQAFTYAKQIRSKLEKDLPSGPRVKFLLDFARLCDWNSKYEQCKRASLRAFSYAKKLQSKTPEENEIQLFAATGARCMVTRAEHMLLGPIADMNWPQASTDLKVPFRTKLSCFLLNFGTSVLVGPRLRLYQFRNRLRSRLEPDAIYGTLAEQYYLDHHFVLVSIVLRWASGSFQTLHDSFGPSQSPNGTPSFVQASGLAVSCVLNWLWRTFCRMVAARLKSRVEAAGAAYTQADVYLFRARSGLERSPVFALYIWNLVGNPVGAALLRLVNGQIAYRQHRVQDATRDSEGGYRLAAECGNHLTSLKAIIAIYHLERSHKLINAKLWYGHLGQLEGDRHKEYFVRVSHQIVGRVQP